MERVLVVDHEEGLRNFIGQVLEGEGLSISMVGDGDSASHLLEHQPFHLLIADLTAPHLDGMALLRKVKSQQPETEVVVLAGQDTVPTAIEAMKLGAFGYLDKPLSGPDELRLVSSRALERRRLRAATVNLSEGNTPGVDPVPAGPAATLAKSNGTVAGEKLEDLEREAIRHMLTLTGGHRKQTAARLGIGLRTLYDKLKLYNL